jgi:4-aminobutyrate aminotransferase-like enzyme
MSICIAADQQSRQPDNAYLGISQSPIRELLPKFAKIHPNFARAVFREACGLSPSPSSKKMINWLDSQKDNFSSPIGLNLRVEPVAVLDLGMSSHLLSSDPSQNDELLLTPRLKHAIQSGCATVGIGQYNEARYLNTTSEFPSDDDPTNEYRTIHLGIDLFAPAESPVYAPMDGIVHAYTEKSSHKDYGHVILLEHKSDQHPTFYTLYGHLGRSSLDNLRIGQTILKGGKFASLGHSNVNGGWTPHLHFQIITDLLELDCNFPGIVSPKHRSIWLNLCPDPNLILGIPGSIFPLPQPSLDETLSSRLQRMGRNQSISYREPLKIVRGWKQYLFDQEGRKYLDAYNNVAHVGHSHPRIVAAAQHQIGVLNTNTRYLHDSIIQYAEELTSLLPDPLTVCYFVNSGSEANELALRLARAFTGQRDMIVLDHAYHGNTNTLIDISPYKHNGPGGNGTPDWVHIAPIPDDYRGNYKRNDPLAGENYAHHVFDLTVDLANNDRGLAGFIAESLPSVGGQIVMPAGYLKNVFRYIRQAGGVCIVDDVQTGFGRIGTHFWGFNAQDVVPDIVVLGKPIGNGHPIGAVITTPAIADAFNNGMEFFSTFGGNPVSCVIGLEVLKVVQEERLQENALRVGDHLLNRLRPLIDQYPIIGDVRGSGLFIGVELVHDRETLEPAAEEASYVMNGMRQQGILLGIDGPYHNVVKIRPPLPFDMQNADQLVDIMIKVLSDIL